MKKFIAVALLAQLAMAQIDLTIFNDFTRSQVTPVGDALWEGASTTYTDLVPPQPDKGGGFWITTPQAILLDWSLRFAFRIDEPVAPEDQDPRGSGIVFAIQTMGPEWIANSPSVANFGFFQDSPDGNFWAMEFDTYSDGWSGETESVNHYAIWHNDQQIAYNDSIALPDWNFGQDVAVTLQYTAETGLLRTYIGNDLTRAEVVDFPGIFGDSLVSIDSPRVPIGTKGAYFGFMAANGPTYAYGHKILSVQVVFDSIAPPPDQSQVLSTIILVLLGLTGVCVATCIVVYHRVKYPHTFAPTVNDQILSTIKVPPSQKIRPLSSGGSSRGSRGSKGSRGSRGNKRHSKSSKGSRHSRSSGGKKRSASRH